MTGNPSIAAVFYGPDYDISLPGTADWYGSVTGKSYSVSGGGNGGMHFDESLKKVLGSNDSTSPTLWKTRGSRKDGALWHQWRVTPRRDALAITANQLYSADATGLTRPSLKIIRALRVTWP